MAVVVVQASTYLDALDVVLKTLEAKGVDVCEHTRIAMVDDTNDTIIHEFTPKQESLGTVNRDLN
jgi:hypothetical protein